MTEPSKEAIEAAQANGTSLDRIRITEGQARVILKAALPIERERWEKDVRERLAAHLHHFDSEAKAADELALQYAAGSPQWRKYKTEGDVYRYVLSRIDLDSIFEKGEGGG